MSKLTAEELILWRDAIGDMRERAAKTIDRIEEIEREVKAGTRQPNSPIEESEKDTLRQELSLIAQHLRSFNEALGEEDE